MAKIIKIYLIGLITPALLTLTGCVYFNTMYNANEAYDQGYALYREEQRKGQNTRNQSREQFRRAVEKGKKIIAEHPDSKYVDDAYMLVGKSYYYLGQYSLAKNFLEDLNENFPESPLLAEGRLFLGRSYMETEDYSLARYHLESLAEGNFDNTLRAQAYLGLADLSRMESNPEAMLSAVQSAITLAEDNELKADAAWRTALWAIETENFDEAKEYYRQASEYTQKPQFDRDIQFELAQLYRIEGNLEQALDAILQMTSDESYTEMLPQLELERALIYEARNDTSVSAEAFRYIVDEHARTPAAARAHYYLGNMAFDRLDLNDARNHYQQVTRIDRDSDFRYDVESQMQKITTFQQVENQISRLERLLKQEIDKDLEAARQDTSGNQARSSGLLNALQQVTGGNSFEFETFRTWAMEKDSSEQVREYLDKLFHKAEILIFDLGQIESGLALADKLANSGIDRNITAKTLLLEGYVHDQLLNNQQQAEEYYRRLASEYGETETAREYFAEDTPEPAGEEINTVPAAAKQAFATADSLVAAQAYRESLDQLKQIYSQYPESSLGGKALFTVAWIFDEKIANLDSAIYYYNEFTQNFREHPAYNQALSNSDRLKTVQRLLAMEAERKNQNQEQDDETRELMREEVRREPEAINPGQQSEESGETSRQRLLERERVEPGQGPPPVPNPAFPDTTGGGRPDLPQR